MTSPERKGSLFSLLPFFVFIGIYLLVNIVLGDDFQLPILVAFLIATLVGFIQFPSIKFEEKLSAYCTGAGNPIIMMMIMIFLFAGAFAALANHIGAIDSIINFSLTFISPSFFIAGLFLIAAFISISIGTSVGTIVALAPLAVGLDSSVGGTLAISLAAIIGGAMFGDNLSFISDTTIAAAKTQEISMKDKFKVNIRIVIVPAIIAFILYAFGGNFELSEGFAIGEYNLISILPYLLVFVVAILGVNVIWALVAGIIAAYFVGIFTVDLNIWEAIGVLNSGMKTMFELSLICIVIGGMVGITRLHGGVEYILTKVTSNIRTERAAELGIAGLTALVNASIANNTITIIITGPIAKEIVQRYHLDPRRSASIMDTIACTVQGCLPYGGQVLAVLAIASYQVTAFEIISQMYYPMLVGLATILVIVFRKYAK